MWYCYILECSDSSYYVGITTDLQSRIGKHNRGRGAAYTSTRRPVQLLWSEEHPNRSAAMKRERQLKEWKRAKKHALIESALQTRSKGPRKRGPKTPEGRSG